MLYSINIRESVKNSTDSLIFYSLHELVYSVGEVIVG